MHAWLNKRQDDKQESLNYYEKKLKKDENFYFFLHVTKWGERIFVGSDEKEITKSRNRKKD